MNTIIRYWAALLCVLVLDYTVHIIACVIATILSSCILECIKQQFIGKKLLVVIKMKKKLSTA